MKEMRDWCIANVAKIEALTNSIRANQPQRTLTPAKHSASDLIRISGQIRSTLDTLRYVSKKSSAFKDLVTLVGNERTPDNAYFSPAPNLSLGDPGGVGAAAGLAADLGGAVLAVFKGAREEKRFAKSVEKDPSELKRSMMQDYCELLAKLEKLAQLCADGEATAAAFHKRGLNRPILSEAWTVAQNHQWLVFAA
jgi:hypothetical protein